MIRKRLGPGSTTLSRALVDMALAQDVDSPQRFYGISRQLIEKGRFWATHAEHGINERQRKVVKRLLDAGKSGFEGGMSAEKYGNLTGTSKATATRDLAQLQKAGMLVTTGQGRATRYRINLPGWSTGEAK